MSWRTCGSDFSALQVQIVRRDLLADVILHVRVARRTARHVLVHGRHLLVPADAEAGALGQADGELHAQHARRARGVPLRAARVLLRQLLGHHHLDAQPVRGLQAAGVLDVADRRRVHVLQVQAAGEFDLGGAAPAAAAVAAAGDGVVRLPAVAHVARAQRPHILVQHALALAAELGGVLGAGGRDQLGTLLDAPAQLAHAPPPRQVAVRIVVLQAAKPQVYVGLADRVDERRVRDLGAEVGGREDADRGAVLRGGHEGALQGERVQEGKGFERRGRGGGEYVGERAEGRSGGCRKVAGQEVGEGARSGPLFEGRRLENEGPGFEGRGLRRAVGAIFHDGPLDRDPGQQFHAEGLDAQLGIRDVERKLARQQRAAGGLRVAVGDEGWRFDGYGQMCRLDGADLGAHGLGRSLARCPRRRALALILGEMEDVHGVKAVLVMVFLAIFVAGRGGGLVVGRRGAAEVDDTLGQDALWRVERRLWHGGGRAIWFAGGGIDSLQGRPPPAQVPREIRVADARTMTLGFAPG